MVTEHLPNNRAVVEGIFQWTKPGDLLALKHHNYYGFDGHHQKLGDESSMNMYIWYAYVFIYIVHMLLQKYVFVFFSFVQVVFLVCLVLESWIWKVDIVQDKWNILEMSLQCGGFNRRVPYHYSVNLNNSSQLTNSK